MRASLFLSLLTAGSALFSNGVLAAPEKYGHEARQSTHPFITTGPQGSGIQVRLEIRQLMAREDQWSLFILALRQWQDRDNSDAKGKSFYSIAGIHGVPRLMWNEFVANPQCLAANPMAYGYCMHQSCSFPAWHRVYAAEMEKHVIENAIEVAQQYPLAVRGRMMQAAQNLRIPYHDFAAHAPAPDTQFPRIFTQAQISVNGPAGMVTVKNPLFSYTFDNAENTGKLFRDLHQWKNTLRWPTDLSSAAQSQNQLAVDALTKAQPTLQEQVYNVLSNCPKFQPFSNTDGGSSQCSNSLEGIHNSIHAAIGGQKVHGHMASLPFSAFDPYFMILHTGADRLTALWQALNPNSWGCSQPIGYVTVMDLKGTVTDANSGLVPFVKDASGALWTTNTARDWRQFGYDYPEFVSTDGSRTAIMALVNALYGPNAKLTAGSIPVPSPAPPPSPPKSPAPTSGRSPPSAADSTPLASPNTDAEPSTGSTAEAPAPAPSQAQSTNSSSGQALLPWLAPGANIPGLADWLQENGNDVGKTQAQYVANIVVDASELGGRTAVYVFKGDPTQTPDSYLLDDNLIGYVSFMGHSPSIGSNSSSYGAVPLSFYIQKLVNQGQLANADNSTVLPWLKANLQWRIVGPNAKLIQPADVPGFSLTVYSSFSNVTTPGGLPVWAPVTPHIDVTKGTPGGATEPPKYATQITNNLLGQSGAVVDTIGEEIAKVVGATLKHPST